MMVPDYDAADPAPTTEQQASAYRDVEEEAPWIPEFCCELNVPAMHPDGRRKFVRTGALQPNLDIKTYDVGNLFVATTDGTAVNWGKLWIEYDVSLFVPQLGNQVPGVGTLINVTGAGTGNTSFGGTAPVSAGTIVVSVVGNVLTFQGLNVGAEYQLVVVDDTAAAITRSALVGLTQTTVLAGGGSGILIVTYVATAATGGITLALASATSQVYLEINQMPQGSLL
jgi:hypothetical protein